MKTKLFSMLCGILFLLFAESCEEKAISEVVANEKTVAVSSQENNVQLLVPFVHPGGLHTQADLDRMKAKVASNALPWKNSWDILVASPKAQLSWNPNPQAIICRGGHCSVLGLPQNYTTAQRDIAAAYQTGLRYQITGDVAYANKAIQILNAWSSTLTEITGDSNQSLAAGTIGWQFAVTGELMRNYSGWTATDKTRFKDMLQNIFYPKVDDFLVRHHNTCVNHYRMNWDACNVAALVAIGVFCDNQSIFNQGIEYLKNGTGNGSIQHAVWYIHPDGTGQTEEAGRDQGHNMGGLHWLGVALEIAWNQGVDMYGWDNNRFLKGIEYTAKFNLGNAVPFEPWKTCQMNYFETEASDDGIGGFHPMWAQWYNHYVNRMGLSAPYTAQVVAQMGAEGGPDYYGTHPAFHDQLGFGTLTFTREQAPGPMATGIYRLRNRATGKFLDNLGNTANGATVAQWTGGSSNNQKWNISYSGGFYQLSCVTGGKFLDSVGNLSDGSTVGQWTNGGNANQQWSIIDLGGGYFKVINRANGKCLDTGGSTADGAAMQFWGSGNSQNQQWAFVTP